jgi:hypothetical protein
MKDQHEIAEEHWRYIEAVLSVHERSKEVIEMIGFHYKTAFVHGWKHGMEETP